jgi:hypothetical protein
MGHVCTRTGWRNPAGREVVEWLLSVRPAALNTLWLVFC